MWSRGSTDILRLRLQLDLARAEEQRVQAEKEIAQAEKERVQVEEKLAEERVIMRERVKHGFHNDEMRDAGASVAKLLPESFRKWWSKQMIFCLLTWM